MSQEDTGIFRPGIAVERANLANLFRQTPEMVCILAGPDHRFEFVNEAHVRALGFNATGMTVREAQPESIEVHGILDEVYRSGKTASHVEIPVTLTNRLRYFNVTYAARRNGRDEINGIMVLGSEATDTVLARNAQENQRQWLESVLDRLPTPILFFDPKTTRITFENRAAKELKGDDLEGQATPDCVGKGFVQVFRNGREATADELPWARANRGENLRDQNYTLVTRAGRFDVSIATDLFPAAFGQPETALMLIQDITTQKKTEATLRKTEVQLSTALNVSKVGFYDWDIVRDEITFSAQMRKDWGLPAGALSTLQTAIDRIHPEDRARVSSEVEIAMKNHEDYRIDYRVVRDSGEIVWLEVRGNVQYDESGKPIRFFGTSIDVTERQATVESLRQSEHAVRRLADTMPQVVWTARPDGVLYYTNAQWSKYSGSSDPEKWLEAVHSDDVERVVPIWIESVTTGKPYETEFRLRRADGIYRWFLVRALAVRDDSGAIAQWLGTCTDIEAQKLAEGALRNAQIAAESANSAKSAFLANMSHEIRTPLGAILGFVGLMKNPKVSPDNLASYISVIERNSDHLLRIIDDILDLSKVEAGQMQIEKIEFSLSEILADFASLMGFRARQKGIEFDVRALSGLPVTMISDPTRIRQILVNVVGNALKFTEQGSVWLDVEYRDGKIRFVVTDTGLGISPDQVANLFLPFTQADVSTTRKFGGTGLGLVLTRHLCEALGGEFHLIESILGKGSRFEASIRVETKPGTEIVPADVIRFDPAPPSHAATGIEIAGLRILIVEDSPDNQTLFRLTLEDAGALVTVVGDGEAGVAAALAEPFDVVLMDIQMPRKDGHAAARELRHKGFTGPLIALTAHAMREERERCIQSGFTDFLTKPISGDTLLAHLRTIRSSNILIVVVEDDADIRESVGELLAAEGYAVKMFANGEDAIEYLGTTREPVLVLADLALPGMGGEALIRMLSDRPDRNRFRLVIASGRDDLPARVRQLGADGSLRKPFDIEGLLKTVTRFTGELSRTSLGPG